MSVVKKSSFFAAFAAGWLALAAPSQAQGNPPDIYRVGGATAAISPNSLDWAWNRSYITEFRGALQNPAYFGSGGIVQRSIVTVDISSINATSLAGVNMFVGTWNSDADWTPAMVSAVTSFFFNGGDLFLLQDDPGHDPIGSALGLATTASTGSVSNGGAPLYNGPFGVASNVTQLYNVGQLSEAAVTGLGGTVAGRNQQGQVTSAFWLAGQFAPGAGALFINADIDMIATTNGLCPLPQCGAAYNPLNSNGIFALNTFAFVQQQGGTPPIPEPSTLLLLSLGVAALGLRFGKRSSMS